MISKSCIPFLLFCMVCRCCLAQDSILISRLLHRLAERQVTKDSFYYPGMYPSFRYYASTPSVGKPDNNIFFTALIAFTLQQSEQYLSPAHQTICQYIISKVRTAYPYFQNPSGRYTYNFWSADPPEVFPNSWFINDVKKAGTLPDDLDDTDIILLTEHVSDSIAASVKRIMALHANTTTGVVRNSFRRYKYLKAYSTWFGEKMPIDFDFCVLCNTLYFINAYHLPYNVNDSATIQLLSEFIRNREYVSRPAYISPHYARTPVLLYHIARLINRFPIPALVSYNPQLIKEAQYQLTHVHDFMDKVILSTALLRLGAHPPALAIPANIPLSRIENNNFVFFIAGFYSMLPNPLKRLLSDMSFIKYFYKCPSYNDALVLEYLILRQHLK